MDAKSDREDPIRNVVIVGAGGSIGSVILSTLLSHNRSLSSPPEKSFTITALTRPTSTYNPPDPSVSTAQVDFTSSASLIDTLTSLRADVLFSCVPADAVTFTSQKMLIDAAVAAGVRLFFPSEYGADLMSEQFGRFPERLVGEKRKVRGYLEETLGRGYDDKKEMRTKWASVNGGPFADMWFPKFFDVRAKKATIYGPGTNRTCWTLRSVVAKAILRLLLRAHIDPDRSQLLNRGHLISGVLPPLTMNAILTAAEKYSTGKETWEVERHPIEPVREEVERARENGDERGMLRPMALLAQFDAEGWAGRAADFSGKGLSNEVLGVEAVGVEQMVKRLVEMFRESDVNKQWN